MMSLITDFAKKHDPTGTMEYSERGWTYFPDGAVRENSNYGALREPPTDPHQRAKAVGLYWSLRLKAAVSAFDELKQALKLHAHAAVRDGANPPNEESLAELKRRKAEVETIQAKSAEADANVQATIPAQQLERAAQKAARQKAGQAVADKLNRITV